MEIRNRIFFAIASLAFYPETRSVQKFVSNLVAPRFHFSLTSTRFFPDAC